ncbi:MAG: hypothetical protein ABSE53_04830 [Terracidiphilus sp.]
MIANTSTINRTETMTRQIRVGPGIASEPFKSFYFLDTASILNCTEAFSGNYPEFDRLPPLGGIGQPKGKIQE